MREDALLHAGHEHDRELEALHGVERDERRGRRRLLPLVLVGHERDLLEERRQLLVERKRDEFLREAAQLEHVRVTLLALLSAVLEIGPVAGAADDLVDELRQLALAHVEPQALEKASE